MAVVSTTQVAPKRHTAFAQVVYRKMGEGLDLAGKVTVGFGGFASVFSAHRLEDIDGPRLVFTGAVGGVLFCVGVYLRAKAEEA